MARIIHGTLVASTVATVTPTMTGVSRIEVVNITGATAIYFTADGTTPTVAGNDCEVLPAIVGATRIVDAPSDPVSVKLISSGTPGYCVAAR